MEFDFDFFEDEVRCGFYVSSLMKRYWAAQLKVLQQIDNVCRDNHITWYLHSGTLLGAVRHRGFIPWDDDIDISMKRTDYEKFRKIFMDQRPSGMKFFDFEAENCDELWGRVVNSEAIDFSDQRLGDYYGMPYVVGVDIFPLDNIAEDETDEKLRCELANAIIQIRDAYRVGKKDIETIENRLKQIEEICNVSLPRDESLEKELLILVDRLFQIYNDQETKDISSVYFWMTNRNHRYPSKCFDRAVLLPFENQLFPAPMDYRIVLERTYHNFYETVRSVSEHNYPCFAESEQKVLETVGSLPYKYEFKKSDLEKNYLGEGQVEGSAFSVLFLPYRTKHWRCVEPIWSEAQKDETANVYVMPVPFYDINVKGQMGNRYCEMEQFPENVPVLSWEGTHIDDLNPDIIIIQNPYDSYTCGFSVDPEYYVSNLKNRAKFIVYIPPFVVDDFTEDDTLAMQTLDYFVAVPGVVQADVVFLQSENMKRIYINKLCQVAGEETRELWEKKLIAMGSPLQDESGKLSKCIWNKIKEISGSN